MDICSNVAIVNWNRGYAFLINNPDVATVQMTFETGETTEEVIPSDRIPYTFYISSISTKCVFLDAKGNEVR